MDNKKISKKIIRQSELNFMTQYTHITHVLQILETNIVFIHNACNELIQNSSVTKAEIVSLKTLINDLNNIKGTLSSISMLLQNTLIPNLEYKIINEIQSVEDEVTNNLNLETSRLYNRITNYLDEKDNIINNKLDNILSKINR